MNEVWDNLLGCALTCFLVYVIVGFGDGRND